MDLLREEVGTERKEELTSIRLKSKAFIDRGPKKTIIGSLKIRATNHRTKP